MPPKRPLSTISGEKLRTKFAKLDLQRSEMAENQKRQSQKFWAQADLHFYGIRLQPIGCNSSAICVGCFRDVPVKVFAGFLRPADAAFYIRFVPGMKACEDDWLPPMCHLCGREFTLKHAYHIAAYILIKSQSCLLPDLAGLIRDYVYGIKYN